MKRLVLAVALVCAAVALAAAPSFAGGGNSDAAHSCQQGGWQTLHRADGSGFTNTGDCVSYAAQGGQFGAAGATLAVSDQTCFAPFPFFAANQWVDTWTGFTAASPTNPILLTYSFSGGGSSSGGVGVTPSGMINDSASNVGGQTMTLTATDGTNTASTTVTLIACP